MSKKAQQQREEAMYMTVQQLIGLLQQCDPNMAVIASVDPEGNAYGSIVEVDSTGLYDPKRHTVLIEKLTPKLKAVGYSQDHVFDPEKGHVKAVILWPDA